jgi:uncharacterized Ntn-hydrolase superfamily protein
MSLSTFSISALDQNTGDFGVVVQSKFLAVGAIVPWARAGIGAIATQAHANVSFGPVGLDLLEQDVGAIDTLEQLLDEDEGRQLRQVGLVDADGTAAAFTGEACMEWAGHITGAGYTVQGNILAGVSVLEAMATTFESMEEEDLPERLLAGLEAGQEAGGDKRGQQSAALLVVRENGGYGSTSDRMVDLRVDDHSLPIEELQRPYRLHQLYFGVTDPARLLKIQGDLATEIQRILYSLGYYNGPITGLHDDATRQALEQWHHTENFEERLWQDAFIDPEVLAYMREKAG